MFPEDALLPISALQHLLFCERQCALIHLEQLWAENRFTAEGRHLHEKADAGRGESRGPTRGGVRVARGLLLRSLDLGLFGKADVVEFRGGRHEGTEARRHEGMEDALSTIHHSDTPTPPYSHTSPAVPFPVEYKRGRPKKGSADEVQLCAQGLCLEEMLGVAVPAGALFYGKTRRRVEVAFDPALRELTLGTIRRLHELIGSRRTPPAVLEKKCERCSLKNLCLPDARLGTDAASRYLRRVLTASTSGGGPVSE